MCLDRPIAALLTDRKAAWHVGRYAGNLGCELGRTPTVELPTPARMPERLTAAIITIMGFPCGWRWRWMWGGNVHGKATHEFGFKATENPVHVHDFSCHVIEIAWI